MKKKILFAEPIEHYQSLGLIDDLDAYECVFYGIRFYKKDDSFLKSFSAFVTSYYTSSISMWMAMRCRSLGIKTIFVTDGVYDLANSFKNHLIKKYQTYLYEFLPHEYVMAVGDIPMKDSCSQYEKYLPKRMVSRAKMPLPKATKVLITTSNSPYFNEREKTRLIALMIDVAKYLAEKKIDTIYRIYDGAVLSALEHGLGSGFNNSIGRGFEDVLEEISHVITTPSSVSITSMFHGRCVAQLIYRSEPPGVQTAWNISSIDIFDEVVDSFFEPDAGLLRFQESICKTYFDGNETLKNIIEQEDGDVVRLADKAEWFKRTLEQRMLTSHFNLNFEYLARRIYLSLRSTKFMKLLRQVVKS